MKLYVPTNGDQLRLTSDWSFTLYDEKYGGNRNKSLGDLLQIEKVAYYSGGIKFMRLPPATNVSLPIGTVLQVDRVYIRKFNSSAASVEDDYDSITFQIIEHPAFKRVKGRKMLARFWAKLCDVNKIEFEHASPPRWSEEKE